MAGFKPPPPFRWIAPPTYYTSSKGKLSVQDDLSEEIKLLTKSLYDFSQSEEGKKHKDVLKELIVDNFDEEQVWQQIELQNNAKWDNFIKDVSTCVTNKNFAFPIKEQDNLQKEDSDADDYEMANDDNDNGDDDVSDVEAAENDKSYKINKHVKRNRNVKTSIVDDKFFNLNEMEKFLDEEDRKEMIDGKVNKHNEESDDESIDLFEASDEEDDDDSAEDDEKNYDIKYDDFFGESNDNDYAHGELTSDQGENEFDKDDGSDADGDDLVDTADVSNPKKSVRFNLDDSESDDNSEVVTNKNTGHSDKTEMSSYELRQQRLQQKINKLEEKNLSEKPWQLKGEVDASTRPQNSLLEEVVDFDMTTRPAPIITEETTLKLEDIIRQRIKDKVWDDVERKAKPVPETREFRKQIILDQQKSELSLAQVYEQEFLKQKRAMTGDEPEDEEEPEAHKKIKTAMKTLFAKLDALSNYHYTPKLAQTEVKIVSNIPAISMEEVAPVATSDAALLAPEEVKGKKKGELMSKTERTSTDKKRERRKKKILQRERQKEKNKKENLINKLNPGLGNKYSKEKASKLLDKVSKDFKNTEKMTQLSDAKSLKSSKAFFTQLNDDLTSVKKPRNKKDLLPAKKYKL